MLVTKEFKFDAAHHLTKYHGKCERMHGHTYKMQVTIEGEVQENGMVLDFVVLKNIVNKQVISKVDHHNLNDLLENPTTENLVVWIWEQLQDLPHLLAEEKDDPNLPDNIKRLLADPDGAEKEINTQVHLYEIKLWESATSFVTYRGK